MLYAILEKETGKELYYKGDNEVNDNEIAVEELRVEDMENPYFDFVTREFYNKEQIT
jgi:hypothetical protein